MELNARLGDVAIILNRTKLDVSYFEQLWGMRELGMRTVEQQQRNRRSLERREDVGTLERFPIPPLNAVARN